MTLKCSHCGAPLEVAANQAVVTCGYCHTSTRIDSTGRAPRERARSSHPRQTAVVGFAVAGVVTTGAIAAFVAQSSARQTSAPVASTQPATTRPTRPPAVTETKTTTPVALPEVPPPPPEDPMQGSASATASSTSSTRPKNVAKSPTFTGPVLTKKDAEEVIRPALLACMKEHGVHYLITRAGNEPRGGSVPPLGLTGTSIVDYLPTPGFANTPLGRCVAKAASAVRAPAYGGNYIYFGLRHDSVPDPLASAAARLDTAAAKKALEALDDEARDCITRSPAGSRPGESVRVMVFFQGATGKVSSVEPYYVDTKSAYGRCLTAVYRKATVDKFREIDHKVLHILDP